MTAPTIVVYHDEPAPIVALLQHRYGNDYRVVGLSTGAELEQLVAAAPTNVAVVIADRTVRGEATLDTLANVRRQNRHVVRAVLSPAADRLGMQASLAAVASGQVDRCLPAPWGHPDVGFYPLIAEMVADWWCRTSPETASAVQLTVVAPADHPRLPELRDIADRNKVPTRFLLPDDADGGRIVADAGAEAGQFVVAADGRVPLIDPPLAQIGGLVGARLEPEHDTYDLVIVGAGPSGLAAAVYGASEGLSTVVLEGVAIGGQAGTSSAIRNYPGFPYGVSGDELAMLIVRQAWTLGAQTVYRSATAIEPRNGSHIVTLDSGTAVAARAVILATGVRYRRLRAAGLERHHGAGVFYGAARAEASACAGRDVHIVGGGNSAGQAAVHLAQYARNATILVRGADLATTMSDYLVRQIRRTPNIHVQTHSEITAAHGDDRLRAIEIRSPAGTTVERSHGLFVMIGAEPDTAWLPSGIARDADGFILTGGDIGAAPPRLTYETTVPGVFAIGDVRHGSVKRVATAVGEGAVSIASVHEHLRASHRVPATR